MNSRIPFALLAAASLLCACPSPVDECTSDEECYALSPNAVRGSLECNVPYRLCTQKDTTDAGTPASTPAITPDAGDAGPVCRCEPAKHEPWRPLDATTGWAPSTTDPSYFRDALGVVHLRGGLMKTAGAEQTLGRLPLGYRPAQFLRFDVPCAAKSTCSFVVANDGLLSMSSSSEVQTATQVALDSVSFRASDEVSGDCSSLRGESWREAALSSSWRPYSDVRFASPAFYKDALGRVRFRGMAEPKDQGQPTAQGTLFYLPPGYRPSQRLLVKLPADTGPIVLDITPAGEVNTRHETTVKFISLAGLHFLAE